MNVKSQLLNIGLSHFARDGYEGASLAKIAAEAGIKKPSIYAHFDSKADLFYKVLKRAARVQQHSIMRYILEHRQDTLEQQLHGLLHHILQLYHTDDTIKFVVRMSFFPPQALEQQVFPLIYNMLDELERHLIKLFQYQLQQEQDTLQLIVSVEQAARAYMTCADGIVIEVLYGQDQRSIQRLDTIWPIYWRGIIDKSE
ncbi:TetR/AcrR family transcriptional regulator [Paenibacillus sp. WLX2291]|uniref:TetR/AcrR family transcriptional regulator n=1 Tax=Paenibacillus sp. WLX2291 TaxID=3296934 RepID=UPI0039843223